ncbi:MAG: trypsin-like serine protease [Rhodobacteraceae bacterium]|nr:trypsin-like serine protease [Paracoccaceae bacterium]
MSALLKALAACAAMVLAGAALAENTSLRQLSDREDLLGWEAVGRLDFAGKGFCSGTLIAPDLVLTAAHCVYNRDGQLRAVGQIQFRAGLQDGSAIADRQALQIAAHPGYRPGRGPDVENVTYDVALIRLENPISSFEADPFVLHSGRNYGDEISVTSYGMGRAEVPSRQRSCTLMAEFQQVMMIDCNVTFGSSGAPVFSQVGGRGRILSVVSSGGTYQGRKVAFGMQLADRVAELKAQLRRNPVAAVDRRIKRIRVGGGNGVSGAKFIRPGG